MDKCRVFGCLFIKIEYFRQNGQYGGGYNNMMGGQGMNRGFQGGMMGLGQAGQQGILPGAGGLNLGGGQPQPQQKPTGENQQ